MRRLVFIALLAAATASPQENAGTKQPAFKAKKLSRVELDRLLAHPGEILLIDVRRPDEVAAIGGFPVYLSIQAADLEKNLSEIPKDRLIVTVSNHAARGGRAADLLESKGFRVAGTVGVEDYASEGGKIVKLGPPRESATPRQ